MRCPACKRKLAAGARFCHHCGAELPPELAATNGKWYHEPIFVLLMIFLVLAIFGLPLLWKSPKFTNRQKAVVSIVTIGYTAAILWLMYYMVFVVILPYYNQLKNII
ncbi:zinc ribbon domain-containing protein [Candidatus Poribacteria bacterium]|nr:zinc ribbon domain-containing protein [Candidatus Poribacteria bacterium]